MKLFTSSFARAGREEKAISISRGKPRGWTGKTFDTLAPNWDWVKNFRAGIWNWGKYTEVYEEMLSELDAENITLALGNGAIMLCFCSVTECHRRLVSAWIERETGLIVPEWNS